MQKLMLFLTVVLCTISCKKENNTPDGLPSASLENVAYGAEAGQKMDIYLPAKRDTVNTKLMVLVHGGAWSDGDKADINPYITVLQQKFPDYAFANINYRLYSNGKNKFPAQENDVKAAISFLLNKRPEYLFSRKVVLLGVSAGAHLALLQGYKHTDIIKPRAIVSFFGPSDLTHLYNNPGLPLVSVQLAAIAGATPALNAAIYQESSPVNYIRAQSAPTILLQGGKDVLVPPVQATLLQDQLEAAGVVHQLVLYPNEGHGWTGANLDDSFNKVEAFLKAHVQ